MRVLLIFILILFQEPDPPIVSNIYFVSGKVLPCHGFEVDDKFIVFKGLNGETYKINKSLVDLPKTQDAWNRAIEEARNQMPDPLPANPPEIVIDDKTVEEYSLRDFKKQILKLGFSEAAWQEEFKTYDPKAPEPWKARVAERAELQAQHGISDVDWPNFNQEIQNKKEFDARLAQQAKEIEAESNRIALEERTEAEIKAEREKEEQMKKLGFYRISYIVFMCGSGSITYSQNGSTLQKDISMAGLVDFYAKPGEFLYISAQNGDCSGSVQVIISVDHIPLRQATSEGRFKIATTSGRL